MGPPIQSSDIEDRRGSFGVRGDSCSLCLTFCNGWERLCSTWEFDGDGDMASEVLCVDCRLAGPWGDAGMVGKNLVFVEVSCGAELDAKEEVAEFGDEES